MKLSTMTKILCASLFAALTLTACVSKKEEPKDTIVVTMEQKDIDNLLNPETKIDAMNQLQPGKIYQTEKCQKWILFRNVIELEYTQVGIIKTRINADTAELDFWTWGFNPKATYNMTYRFVWFDGQGKPFSVSEPSLRSTLPGDPVRFSGNPIDEKVKNVSLVIDCTR